MDNEKLESIKSQTSDALAISRQQLLVTYAFIGSIAMNLDLVPVRDKRVRTACTDGSSVFVDCSFFSHLSNSERVFVLAHEVWHCCLMHMLRCQDRIHSLFNIATDKEVNYMLSKDNFKVPKMCYMPDNDECGKSAEYMYERLLKQQDSKQQSSSNEKNKANDNGGNALSGQFDRHEYADCSNDGAVPDDCVDDWGEVGFDNDFKPTVDSDLANEMRDYVVVAAQAVERQQGTLPAHIKNIVNKFLKPEVKWEDVLARFITVCFNSGSRVWLPPNRRHVYNDIYLQSRRSYRAKIAVAIDTSGSCLADQEKFLTELMGLVNAFGSYEIHLIQCDAEVSSHEVYDETNPLFPSNNASDLTITGGGGTSFVPVFDFIEKNNIECNALVYFTDSYGDAPKNPPPYPVLWVLTSDANEKFCDWGEKIKFK